MCHTKTSAEPVNQRALSECIAQSDLLPNQRQRLYKVLQENSSVFGSSIAYLTSPPLLLSNTILQTWVWQLENPRKSKRLVTFSLQPPWLAADKKILIFKGSTCCKKEFREIKNFIVVYYSRVLGHFVCLFNLFNVGMIIHKVYNI